MKDLSPGQLLLPEKPNDDVGFPGPVFVNAVYDTICQTETTDQFNTLRGYKSMHQRTGAGKGIMVGIGDTGVDKTHLAGDLDGCIAKDFTGSRNGFYDQNSHGTHVTGHIGSRGTGAGFVGLAPKCDLRHAKVLGDSGSGSSAGIARGIDWLVEQGCKIISLSLGGGFSNDSENSCRRAVEAGVLVFAAMGNSGNRGGGHPGTSRYTFGITAVDYELNLANFSSRDKMAKYSGYGVNVLSLITAGKFARMSGTSMACPDQAGLCANILSYLQKLGRPLPSSMEEYEAIVNSSIKDLGPPGHDTGFGEGFIQLDKVLNTIDNSTNPQPPQPPHPPEGSTFSWGGTLTSDGIKLFTPFGNTEAELNINGQIFKGRVHG